MGTNHNNLGQPIGHPIEDWQERERPPHSAMVGTWCKIEPLDPDRHANELFESYQDDKDGRNWTYLPYGPFRSFKEYDAWLRTDCVGDDPFFHAVVDSQTGRATGVASYLRIVPSVGVIEVGHIHYSPQLQRTPAATEVMYLMMKRVFDELGYRRYEWKCDALNDRSRKAALRLGFQFEGIFRQATINKGRNRDTAWYAIIDKDWPDRKKAFEDWLHPDNFDARGKARTSLAR